VRPHRQNETVTVRPATPTDVEGIARVHTASFRRAYRGLVPDSYLDALRWEDRLPQWTRVMSEGSTVVVAADDGTVVGVAAVGPARDEDLQGSGDYELYAIYVVPRLWGTGLGSRLLEAALATVPASAPVVTLWVLAGNERGRRFYQRHGFVTDGTVKTADIGGAALEEVRYRRPSARPATMQG
jgi:RimJ/RimL family protein N-acetyltransferase